VGEGISVLICFLSKKKKEKKKGVLLFVFVVFNDLGCVCHEQDSIKLQKFIT
jgi:hypothetical protein